MRQRPCAAALVPTAERIRDRIAASKARGMWMGDTPPLGYRPDGRSLAIVEDHAAIVRDIYRRYLVLGNIRLVADALVFDRLVQSLRNPLELATRLGGAPVGSGAIEALIANASAITTTLQKPTPTQQKSLLQKFIDRIEIGATLVQIHIASDRLGKELGLHLAGPAPPILLDTPVMLRRNGMAMRLILQDGGRASRVIDLPLLRAIARGRVCSRPTLSQAPGPSSAIASASHENTTRLSSGLANVPTEKIPGFGATREAAPLSPVRHNAETPRKGGNVRRHYRSIPIA